MINYPHIKRIASHNGVTEDIIEKNYLIELILFYFANDEYFENRLVFRGGTAIKKAYFPDYRYSEDLDFLISDKEDLRKCEQGLAKILEKIVREYPFGPSLRSTTETDRYQFFVGYDIIPEIKVNKELKIDIIKDSQIPAFHERNILFSYEEFKGYNLSLKTYTIEAVISDKIARILDVVNEPRDIYDFWFLLKLPIDTTKMKAEFKKRYLYDLPISSLLNDIKKEEYKRSWQDRLKKQIRDLPDFDEVIRDLDVLIIEKV